MDYGFVVIINVWISPLVTSYLGQLGFVVTEEYVESRKNSGVPFLCNLLLNVGV